MKQNLFFMDLISISGQELHTLDRFRSSSNEASLRPMSQFAHPDSPDPDVAVENDPLFQVDGHGHGVEAIAEEAGDVEVDVGWDVHVGQVDGIATELGLSRHKVLGRVDCTLCKEITMTVTFLFEIVVYYLIIKFCARMHKKSQHIAIYGVVV